MVLVQKSLFFHLFFTAIQARKMSFTIFYNKKKRLSRPKTRSSKSEKIDVFRKGLTHAFDPKVAIFCKFFCQAIQPRKMSFTIFQNKKTPFQAVKTRSSKTRKIEIFFTLFLGNIAQENVFYGILERKHTFLGYEGRKFKNSRKFHFWGFFDVFFYSLERCFFLLDYRKRHFPGLYCLKKNLGKLAIFGPKLCVNPSRIKVSFQTF